MAIERPELMGAASGADRSESEGRRRNVRERRGRKFVGGFAAQTIEAQRTSGQIKPREDAVFARAMAEEPETYGLLSALNSPLTKSMVGL